ncbi:hypothetical protein MPSEU_000087500 [Mayamaea pseudoterrestris]|nr:hypothetical protein MPSEU_000087500 [Mayamaea pseudoterrestris]
MRSSSRANKFLAVNMTFFCILVLLLLSVPCASFQHPALLAGQHLPIPAHQQKQYASSASSSSQLFLFEKNTDYSRQVLLREEAESPFRKVRFFLYASLAGGATISLVVSGTRVLAAWNGINTDLLDESLQNVAVDVGGLIVLGFLNNQDVKAQESRRKRASKGADLARLVVRASPRLKDPLLDASVANDLSFSTSLASLRRGRGIEKRVVIAAGGAEKIQQVLEEATRLDASFQSTDLLLVPVIAPSGQAPQYEGELPQCVALPAGNGWKALIDDEMQEAAGQGVDVESNGFCIVLKKNGRVGQRTSGISLMPMVGDVEQRQASGLDVKNI